MENMPASIPPPAHFKGKDAISHVVEAQASGIISSAEIHGTETSGKIAAGADALRDSSLFLLIGWQLLSFSGVGQTNQLYILGILGISLLVWKAGRSAWLGWSRLERLHRILAQEKWEIEHHRQQERDELRELYAAKGFEGKLLEDVLDVLMADGDRLLKVMVEEELGLSLETYEHPLIQSFGAAIGSFFATLAILLGIFLNENVGAVCAAILCVGIGAGIAAFYAKNKMIPAIIWNLGLLALSYSSFYFLIDYMF
jgi:vacuolar iron transporter family protein